MKTLISFLVILMGTANMALASENATGREIVNDLRGHLINGWYAEGHTDSGEACSVLILHETPELKEIRMSIHNLESTVARARLTQYRDYSKIEESDDQLHRVYQLRDLVEYTTNRIAIDQLDEHNPYYFRLTTDDTTRGHWSCEVKDEKHDPEPEPSPEF